MDVSRLTPGGGFRLSPPTRGQKTSTWSTVALCAVVAWFAALAGCGLADHASSGARSFATRTQPIETDALTDFCQVRTAAGKVPLQKYLAGVVSCEAAPEAGVEALEAQAIVARSYALHVNHAQDRALNADQIDQHYDCGRPIREGARQAVKQTAGVVVEYHDTLVATFYQAGSERQSPSCRGIGPGSTDTEHFITYNSGQRGEAVDGAYGRPSSNDNRGDLSQFGSVCLERKLGKSAGDILRFYYGEDIETTQLNGTCVTDTADPEVVSKGDVCSKKSARPDIVERYQWGAEPPDGLRARHTPKSIAIHHAVTPNFTSKPGAQAVREMQYRHMHGLHNWSDIGYHFVIDRDGTIYRGAPEDRIGAHLAGHNDGAIGVSLLGQYQPPEALGIAAAQPTPQQLKSAGRLAAYLAEKYNFDLTRDTLKGHREYGTNTSCPGDNLLDKLPDIIEYANADVVCSRPPRPYDEVRNTPEFSLEDAQYRYIKIKAIRDNPRPHPDGAAAFEVDSVSFRADPEATPVYAGSVSDNSANVANPSGAVGAADNNNCDVRLANAANLPVGEQLVVEFDQPFGPEDIITIAQGRFGPLEGCSPGLTGRAWASPDGKNWVLLADELVGNATGLTVPRSHVAFESPRDGATYATGELDLRVDASANVQKVDYFVGGTSVGTGTDWNKSFHFRHLLDSQGNVTVTAKAMGSAGQPVASDTVAITVDNTFQFSSPRGQQRFGHLAPPHAPELTMKVTGGPSDMVRVGYEVDDIDLGESSDASAQFPVTHNFTRSGERRLIASGYDADGQVVATAQMDVTISTELEAGLEFITPRANGWYTPAVTFRSRALNPAIISVEYEFGDGRPICRADNPDTDFRCQYTFEETGWVQITAYGYDTRQEFSSDADRQAHKLGETSIRVLITGPDGMVPENQLDPNEGLPTTGTPGDDDNGANGANGGNSFRCQGGTPQGTAQELAEQLLTSDNVTLQGNPRMNLEETSNDQLATAGCGKPPVYLQEQLLAAMVKMSESGSYTVTSLATGCHSTHTNHYRGQAVDIGSVNMTPVRPDTPGMSMMNACKACGATEVRGPKGTPFAFPNNNDHIHCTFP